ncbi:hypothetical protein L596_010545 [Steinernema carpocapsae]|uniref:EF-hand domain-containing protein n=1 Tax=Steinernema carpocapsae TaxID=34508 RepID=A0A4U5PJ68_STECR|nr:hypothetical protein L596_010545 [Steinernema carpocapsae]
MRQFALIGFVFAAATLIAVVSARPNYSSEEEDDGYVTNDSFLHELFEEMDEDLDGLISRQEMQNLVQSFASFMFLATEDFPELKNEYLGFEDFANLFKGMSSPAFAPILSHHSHSAEPTRAELNALRLFRTRIQPSEPCERTKVHKPHRPLHPVELFNSYKTLRNQDHIEELFQEADTDRDGELTLPEIANLMKAYKMRIKNSEILLFFVRAMNARGVMKSVTGNDFRLFLESAARACHKHVTGDLVINKTLRDRCFVQQCLIENEKYRTYPLPNFHSQDKAALRKDLEYYASFVDEGNSVGQRNFNRLLRSKSFRVELKKPIFQC